MADREKIKEERGILADQPRNFFDASCLPWVRYRHFDLHVFDEGNFLAPVVTFGKYEEECHGTIMPLTMNIHHAVADGFHLSRFFCEVQAMIDEIGEAL
jgi:chloramphenicol O-acetyltransferase type A